MKKLLLLIVAFCALGFKVMAQDFYPTNFRSIIISTASGKIIANEDYLAGKNFFLNEDSVFVNKTNSELIKINSNVNATTVDVRIDYYTKATNLSRYLDRAKNCGLDKIDDLHFGKQFENASVRLEVERNVTVNKVVHTRLTFLQKNTSNFQFENLFPMKYEYPFQNTIWYFDTETKDLKVSGEKQYIIQLSKDKKSTNTIEFLDDYSCKVTFMEGKVKQSIRVKYFQDIESQSYTVTKKNVLFSVFEDEPKKETKAKTPKSKFPEPKVMEPRYYSFEELKKIKNTKTYFNIFFNRNYFKVFDGNDIKLINSNPM